MLVTEDNAAAALERIARCKELVVDLETTGLRPYAGDRLFSVAIEAEGVAYYFPFRHLTGCNLPAPRLGQLLEILVAPDKTLGGHNFARFDSVMLAMEGETYERRLLHPGGVLMWDSIIDALLANENEPSFSLDALGTKYLGDAAKKGNSERLVESLRRLPGAATQALKALKGRMAELPPELVATYACGDVTDARRLHEKYVAHHEAWGLLDLASQMYDYARLLARIERRGLLIDRSLAEQRIPLIEAERGRVLAQIRNAAGGSFNPQSPVQVARLCGTPDAQAATIERSGHPLARLITRYKKLGKVQSTYYEGILERLDANNVVHPQQNVTRDPSDAGGTRTGRLSCSHPNLQNPPKQTDDPLLAVRDIIIARPGMKLAALDYEGAERWLAHHYCGDQALADAYHAGRDLYQELAERCDITRQAAKITWLAVQYGCGAYKLADLHGWSFTPRDDFPDGQEGWRLYNEQLAPRVKAEFFDLLPGVKEQMYALADEAEQMRFLRLWTGRVRHFDGIRSKPFAAWNAVLQGGVGEIVRCAMQRAESVLDAHGAEEVLQIHDELVIEVPEDRVRPAVKATAAVMEDFRFSLRPRVEPKVGRSFGSLEAFA